MTTSRKQKILPIEKLQRGLTTAARIVAIYGEDYLPVFEKLESDIEIAKKYNSRMEYIRNIANDNEEK